MKIKMTTIREIPDMAYFEWIKQLGEKGMVIDPNELLKKKKVVVKDAFKGTGQAETVFEIVE